MATGKTGSGSKRLSGVSGKSVIKHKPSNKDKFNARETPNARVSSKFPLSGAGKETIASLENYTNKTEKTKPKK